MTVRKQSAHAGTAGETGSPRCPGEAASPWTRQAPQRRSLVPPVPCSSGGDAPAHLAWLGHEWSAGSARMRAHRGGSVRSPCSLMAMEAVGRLPSRRSSGESKAMRRWAGTLVLAALVCAGVGAAQAQRGEPRYPPPDGRPPPPGMPPPDGRFGRPPPPPPPRSFQRPDPAPRPASADLLPTVAPISEAPPAATPASPPAADDGAAPMPTASAASAPAQPAAASTAPAQTVVPEQSTQTS